MRRLASGFVVALFVLLGGAPAHAAAAGQIDHVEVADNGAVKMLYSVPGLPAGTAPDLDTVRVEVAGKPVEATASPVARGDVERTAVLALDVSDSMRGERFAAAKEAALAYLGAAPDDVSIGLVTFAGSVTVVEQPTTDHARLEAAVAALGLSAGTMLYDGVLEAVALLGDGGQRQVLLLSDGADTGTTPLADVVATAEKSGVNVDVVALEQSPTNQARLKQITDVTDGAVLPADDPAALAAVFAREAEALAEQVLIEFESPNTGEATVSASLDAGASTYTDSTFVSLTGTTEPLEKTAGPIPTSPAGGWIDERVLFGGLAAFGLGLMALLIALLGGRSDKKQTLVERQLAFYSSSSTSDPERAQSSPSFKPQVNVRESAVAMADRIVNNGGLEVRITTRLTAGGLSLTAAEWLLLHAGIVIGCALLGFLLSGGSPVMIFLWLGFGVVGPWMFLRVKESRRLKAFTAQLADTLQLMSGGLSAGLSLPQAVDTVVREGAEPMAGELRRALVEQRLGVDIEDALDGVAERMQSKDFAWVVMAVRIQREIGGNLAELLDTVAATIREREYLRRQVRTLSAEGRLSAWILGGLPPLFVVYLQLTQPDYLAPLYSTTLGLLMCGAAAVMMTIGVFWLKAAVKVEV